MLFSILDVKSGAFGRLFEARKDDEAIRTFLTLIQNSSNQDLIGLYPQDFSLFRIGDFDISTGLLSQDVQPYQLITGIECVQMLKGLNNTSSECSVSDNVATLYPVELNGSEEEV